MPAPRQGQPPLCPAPPPPPTTLPPHHHGRELNVQSLLAVLGKTSSTGNVERVDLKIHDPDHALGGRRRRRRRDDDESDGHGSADEESEDDVVTGIESLLIMKLVCKHGTSPSLFALPSAY